MVSRCTMIQSILRFRGPLNNNNSIRWFNGDLTGIHRLEILTGNRLRLSTFQNKDESYDGTSTFTAKKNQFVKLRNDRFDMENNRIVNVSYPIYPQDIATKYYVDNHNDKEMVGVFTSSGGSRLLGWWVSSHKCAWMEANIYGVTSNLTSADCNIHTYILTNDDDTKNFYDEKTKAVGPTTDGIETWDGNIVIGQSVRNPTENSEFQVYEVMGFDKTLTEAQIFDNYVEIFA